MAGRLPDENMQALRQFVNQSPWDPLPVRRRIAEPLCEAVRPEVWWALDPPPVSHRIGGLAGVVAGHVDGRKQRVGGPIAQDSPLRSPTGTSSDRTI